jgi:lipoate-protein ligase A
MSWRLIDSGPCKAAFNMALDEALALSVRKGDSPFVLRLYSWSQPAVSIGAFQKVTDIDVDYCHACTTPIVRRPTGGRAILHGDELTYSFSARNEGLFSEGLMDSYRKLGKAFHRCFTLIGLCCTMKTDQEKGRTLIRSPLCFESTSLGEIDSSGIKIIGSAQKRWKDAFLQQGSIPFTIDRKRLPLIVRPRPGRCPRNSDYNALIGLRDLLPELDGRTLKQRLIAAFKETFDVTLIDSQPSRQELEVAHRLTEKYREQPWAQGGKANSLSDNRAERSTT